MVAREGPGHARSAGLTVHTPGGLGPTVHSHDEGGPSRPVSRLASGMEIPTPTPVDLTDVAARLERAAGRVDVCATQARVATSTTWRGEAATLHRDRVGEHSSDLQALARRLREAAGLVRDLEAAASRRLDLLGDVDITVGDWPIEVIGRG